MKTSSELHKFMLYTNFESHNSWGSVIFNSWSLVFFINCPYPCPCLCVNMSESNWREKKHRKEATLGCFHSWVPFIDWRSWCTRWTPPISSPAALGWACVLFGRDCVLQLSHSEQSMPEAWANKPLLHSWLPCTNLLWNTWKPLEPKAAQREELRTN